VLLETADYDSLPQLSAGVEAVFGLLLVHAAHHAADGLHHQWLCVGGAIQQHDPVAIPRVVIYVWTSRDGGGENRGKGGG